MIFCNITRDTIKGGRYDGAPLNGSIYITGSNQKLVQCDTAQMSNVSGNLLTNNFFTIFVNIIGYECI